MGPPMAPMPMNPMRSAISSSSHGCRRTPAALYHGHRSDGRLIVSGPDLSCQGTGACTYPPLSLQSGAGLIGCMPIWQRGAGEDNTCLEDSTVGALSDGCC